MYTNIPIEEGIEAMKDELENREDKTIPTDFFLTLLRFILTCNVFEFNMEYWLQLLGTSMGTRIGPTYANIFMAKLEKYMLNNCPQNLLQLLHCWKRYIYDILLIWTGTVTELDDFFQYLNSSHHSMKFDEPQFKYESRSCNFLDLNISIINGKIQTDLYKKPTDVASVLLPSSAHPGHVSPNLVYSLAFRLLRICSTPELLNMRLGQLQNEVLLPRHYKPSVIKKAFEKVKLMSRDEALKRVEKAEKNQDRIVVPFDHNPRLLPPGKIMKKHHNTLVRKNPYLKEVFKSEPMPALRQGKNLRRLLCRAKISPSPTTRPTRTTRITTWWRRCSISNPGGHQCPVCAFTMDPTSEWWDRSLSTSTL